MRKEHYGKNHILPNWEVYMRRIPPMDLLEIIQHREKPVTETEQ